ncbi:hypothetical protein CC1G_07134 [Coprinopsis cinerea okayama7|uniref:Uncharacterized protein n=1 Tax=Coprinopsis cinerea (strain Okayama-7 / 130 / ATCC MYA-4618 / FGSC 9003) TaxID=240176 RepID=A8NR67_COPC7|nr:hypothetical protein CC1G_07134 [Coprinopsis cinerea okayama7\|eukprot:XP_001835710.2 hypothetical protein CC1G_07134 [Coprinopsis cinerea okayama7\
MATVTHTLRSEYDPSKDRERLERDTGQLDEEERSEEWTKEALKTFKKRLKPPPLFVPATRPLDAWDVESAHASTSKVKLDDVPAAEKVDSLYKFLPRTKAESEPPSTKQTARPSPPSVPTPPPAAPQRPIERTTKNNWFIMKAIQSDSASKSAPVTPAPTLADILSREPPPLPSEARVKPPVWTVLGPANKGFSMLQRSGWNEGETLGPYAVRRKVEEPPLPDFLEEKEQSSRSKGKRPATSTTSSSTTQTVEIKLEDGITEVKQVDIVDLTLTSDSESDDEQMGENTPPAPHGNFIKEEEAEENATVMDDDDDVSGHGGRALLAPISTVLKADRMGIGLKPKTVAGPKGAYRIPQKRHISALQRS